MKAGLAPVDALKAATSVNARLLGLDSEIGLLQNGMAADVIAVAGDPSRDINATRRVLFVMKQGRVFRDDRGSKN
jgi:imidazolonepropionase-like amidohydrolase